MVLFKHTGKAKQWVTRLLIWNFWLHPTYWQPPLYAGSTDYTCAINNAYRYLLYLLIHVWHILFHSVHSLWKWKEKPTSSLLIFQEFPFKTDKLCVPLWLMTQHDKDDSSLEFKYCDKVNKTVWPKVVIWI